RGGGTAGRRHAVVPERRCRARPRLRLGVNTRRRSATHAAALRLFAGEPVGPRAAAGRLAPALRAFRSLRFRDRGRRVLFGNPLRRRAAAHGRTAGGRKTGTARLPAARIVLEPLEALEPAGPALGVCGGRRRHSGTLSAV